MTLTCSVRIDVIFIGGLYLYIRRIGSLAHPFSFDTTGNTNALYVIISDDLDIIFISIQIVFLQTESIAVKGNETCVL